MLLYSKDGSPLGRYIVILVIGLFPMDPLVAERLGFSNLLLLHSGGVEIAGTTSDRLLPECLQTLGLSPRNRFKPLQNLNRNAHVRRNIGVGTNGTLSRIPPFGFNQPTVV